MRDTAERLRLTQEENEMITRRRDEIESRLAALEAEYEELLGNDLPNMCYLNEIDFHLEKTINDEETSNVDVAESMKELKVYALLVWWFIHTYRFVSDKTGSTIQR
jgi:kinesin family protein 5